MAKKEWREVPESELTEEEVRRGFNKLRELYKETRNLLHDRKVERGKMRLEIEKLYHGVAVLKKRNKYLEQKIEAYERKLEKKEKPVKEKKVEKSDFKKRFLDSL